MALCFAQVIAAPAPAAPFVNLDFEQAQVQPINPNFIVAATGMPGWTPRIGGVQIANLDYNSIGIGLPAVSLFDREDTQLGLPIPQGLFYAALSSGITLEAEASMEQRGDIPADARSLHLMAQAFESRPMIVLQDQTLPLVQLSPPFPGNGWRWAIFGCDISAFAGVEDAFLKITTGPRGGGAFDDIRFSATQVPEPWANVLVLISAVVLARRRANQGGDFESDAFICGVR